MHLGLKDPGEFTFFTRLKALLEYNNYYSGILTFEKDNGDYIIVDDNNKTKRLCLLVLDDYCVLKLDRVLGLRVLKPFVRKIIHTNEGVKVNLKHSVLPTPDKAGSIIPTDEYIHQMVAKNKTK